MVGHPVVAAGLTQLALAEEEVGTSPEGVTTSPGHGQEQDDLLQVPEQGP